MASVLVVDPRLAVPYYTYVMQGFLDAGLAGALRFERFDLPLPEGRANGAAMSFELSDRVLRLFVSAGDHPDISPEMVEWADAYGKVNLPVGEEPRPNVVAIGPIFGITLWPLPGGYLTALRMAARGAPLRTRIADMRFQAIARLPLDRYVTRPSEQRYVFHASRPWSDKHQGTNDPRERFLAACRALEVPVDGGLLQERLPLSTYVERLQRSAVAFNCPAVHKCLGWKLGEYLALGKAIVSTPLERQLPAPLLHGEHIHYVEDTVEGIADGVSLLMQDLAYRAHLEVNARRWFDEHLAPARVAARLVSTASERRSP